MVSWIWGSILQSTKLLQASICYQVGAQSDLRIKEVSWLPDYPEFRIPDDIQLPDNINQIKDPMEQDGLTWNSSLISRIFPTKIIRYILKTSVLDKELEGPVWIHYTIGDFSIKATHRRIRLMQGDVQNTSSRKKWKAI